MLISKVCHHPSGSTSQSAPMGPATPALFTKMFTGPSCSAVVTRCATWSGADTSLGIAIAEPPARSISCTVFRQLRCCVCRYGHLRTCRGKSKRKSTTQAPASSGHERDRTRQIDGCFSGVSTHVWPSYREEISCDQARLVAWHFPYASSEPLAPNANVQRRGPHHLRPGPAKQGTDAVPPSAASRC